jgi:hypothetical protein
VYFPDAELSDGAAELETDGFFDVYNTPPWDTWIGFFQDQADPEWSYANYLIAWAPPTLIGVVERGIRVNPEDCIKWLNESTVGIRSYVPTK